MFFSREIKFTSNIINKNLLKDFVVPFPKNIPSYYKDIPRCIFHAGVKKFILGERTIKSCPGFLNLYKKSILIKWPFDSQYLFDHERIIYQRNGQDTNTPVADQHSNAQLLNYSNDTKYKFLLKLSPMILIHTQLEILAHPCTYEFNNSVKNVFQGVLTKNYAGYLNFFVGIEKDQDELIIKQGTPLALITPLSDKKIKASYVDPNKIKLDNEVSNFKFSKLNFYKTNKIKIKCE